MRDLYALYPDYLIDVAAEQARAGAGAGSSSGSTRSSGTRMPPLMKLWLDEVLAFGWAYGPGGTALRGKDLWLVATTGGPEDSYHPDSYNRYFFDAFLPPYEQTAALCGMRFLPPLVLHGAHRADATRDRRARAVYAAAPAELPALARDRRLDRRSNATCRPGAPSARVTAAVIGAADPDRADGPACADGTRACLAHRQPRSTSPPRCSPCRWRGCSASARSSATSAPASLIGPWGLRLVDATRRTCCTSPSSASC